MRERHTVSLNQSSNSILAKKSKYAWLIGISVGIGLGYLFGFQQGDGWIGGSIAVVWAITGYGFLAFPEYQTRWSGSHSKFWFALIGVMTLVIMLITPESTLLSDGLPIVVLLGGIWLGGVNAGIALERKSADSIDN